MSIDRKLGFWMCVALVMGNMIGSGVFLLPAALAPYGMNSVIAWLATSAGAIFLALVFSGLSRAFPEAEGPYAYVRLAFGDLPAFVVAWGYWVAIWVGNAALVTGTVSYLGNLFPVLGGSPALNAIISVAAIWTLTGVCIRGVRAAGGVQVVTTVLKLIPLLAVAGLGVLLFVTHDQRLVWHPADAPPISAVGITAAASLTLWALLGFESAAVAAKRVIDPERTIPRATIIGTLLVAAIYILSCTAVMLLTPAGELANSGAPFADVAMRFWGSGAGHAVAIFAAISGFGAMNGWIMLQGELPMQLAQRGVFPAVFARLSRHQTPALGLCISSGLVTLLVLMNFGKSLVEIYTFMILLATTANLVLYLACALAALVLLRNGKLKASGGHVVWISIAAILGGLYALWTLYGAGPQALLWGLVLLVASVPVFYLMRRVAAAGAAA
jgi:APA family basic amino acid/polyamine antiporter